MDTLKIAKMLAQQSIVLLKNEKALLPLKEQTKISIFGRAQIKTVFSGNGSGATKGQGTAILDACETAGIHTLPALSEFYRLQAAEEKEIPAIDYDYYAKNGILNSGIMYELFGQYHAPAEEYKIPAELLEQAGSFSDTAMLVLSRCSGGEECDRHLEEDYYLTNSEKILVEQVCNTFSKVILILNVNGLIDLSWQKEYPSILSVMFIGIPGEEGSVALAELLCGKATPCGKLGVTIAENYEDYPTAEDFSWDKENRSAIRTYESYGLDASENGSTGYDKSPVTVYRENIYTGYRYFDSFVVKPLFPFGFGLSYTSFKLTSFTMEKGKGALKVFASVKNIGQYPGRETLQLYQSPRDTASPQPLQKLCGFEKTSLLLPGEEESLCIIVPWQEIAAFREENAAYVIERGIYLLRLRNSSDNTQEIGGIEVKQDIQLCRHRNRLTLQSCNTGKIEFLTHENARLSQLPETLLSLEEADIISFGIKVTQKKGELFKLEDFTNDELAALCVGYGPGIPFAAFEDRHFPETICDGKGNPLTINSHPVGVNGYVSPAMEDRGIQSVFYKDGPAGIGETVWPTEMLIACSFDRKLWRMFGDAIGAECQQRQVDVWLGPAVNLQRNPLCGRNFEYFSEDPFLTGACAEEIINGLQEKYPVIACPKHFAVNEQETFRRGSTKKNYDAVDSILTERTAREIYLKPFEMLVRNADLRCLMTSFNKINGIYAGGSRDLCTGILREEWGFDGIVITDWGDMDIVVDGADAVAAGNDVVMPGGPPVIAQILKGYEEKRITREEMKTAVSRWLNFLRCFGRYSG